MENKMFCYQCEQTAGCSACTGNAGVCGKKADTAKLQDELTGALIGLARATEGSTVPTASTYQAIIEGLFTTITNVSFDDDSISEMIKKVRAEKQKLVPDCSTCGSPCGRNDDYDMEQLWDADEDIRSLKSLILFGIRGMAAYAYHAAVLGYTDEEVNTLEDRLVEMGQAIDAIENSEFSQNLKTRLTGKFASLPDNIKKVLGGTMGNAQKAGNIVMKNAYNASAKGGLKLASFSGSKIHGIVLDAGHAIGYKFKPWQAIKITKGIAIGGQILSAFGVGLSVFMQIKSDQDEEQMRSDLKSNRQAVRSQFNSAANGLEDYGRTFIKNNIAHSLDASIDGLDENISEIRATRTNKNAICKEMEALHHDCQVMIREIHSI